MVPDFKNPQYAILCYTIMSNAYKCSCTAVEDTCAAISSLHKISHQVSALSLNLLLDYFQVCNAPCIYLVTLYQHIILFASEVIFELLEPFMDCIRGFKEKDFCGNRDQVTPFAILWKDRT